jgi:hypothetical protein
MQFPITEPLFQAVDPAQLSADRSKLLERIPDDFRAFLEKHNGASLPPHTLNFATGIPFDPPSETMPSRTDFIETFLGMDPAQDENWDDLFHFNQAIDPEAFPPGVILVARGHYGDVGLSLLPESKGAVYYQWRHFPSVAGYYQEKRARAAAQFDDPQSAEALEADAFALLERLADSWSEFLDSFLEAESADLSAVADLEMMAYEKMYEQIKRRVAVHNLLVMFQGQPNEKGEALLDEVAGGFLPDNWLGLLRKTAVKSGELYVANRSLEDNWILDRMLDGYMLLTEEDPHAYAVLVHFAQYIGYPLLEIKRSIADYQGRKERESQRQAPPLYEMIQDGREQALRTLQSLYLIGIAAGPVTPEQDQMFAQIAREGELDQEELMFVVRHRDGLSLLGPKFPGWGTEMKEKVAQFLRVNGEVQRAARKKAVEFFELLGSGSEELDQMLARG